MRRGFLFLLLILATCSGAQTLPERGKRFAGLINEAELKRIRSLAGPMISGEGDIYVISSDPTRVALRWPVLRFATRTMEALEKEFYSVGSRDFPLTIELGSETNEVTTLRRDRIQTADGFSQLIIRVPNPHTVELDALRVAIVEASLREEARRLRGKYSALKWPKWFLQGVVDATQGALWQIEAYERLQTQIAADGIPELTAFFADDAAPTREAAAFFARWIMEKRRAAVSEGYSSREILSDLVVADWTHDTVLQLETQESWAAWLQQLDNRVFLPGILTKSQFLRWRSQVHPALSPKDAKDQRTYLLREMVGRPKPFLDLTILYMRATDALIAGKQEESWQYFTEAEEAASFLMEHLEREGLIIGEGVAQDAQPPTL